MHLVGLRFQHKLIQSQLEVVEQLVEQEVDQIQLVDQIQFFQQLHLLVVVEVEQDVQLDLNLDQQVVLVDLEVVQLTMVHLLLLMEQ
jgi:thymidine kinase